MSRQLILHQIEVTPSGDLRPSPLAPVDEFNDAITWRELLAIADHDLPRHFVRFHLRYAIIGTIQRDRMWLRLIHRSWYERVPEPFWYIDMAPAHWEESPTDIPLKTAQPPERTIAQLRAMLPDADGPFLYGGCQTLLDRAKIVLQRPAPDDKTIRELWQLLPKSTQAQTTFITFTTSAALLFDVMVMPEVPAEFPGYLTEDQARDYPESRFERDLQIAIETNDERSFQQLIHRRSSSQTLFIAVTMVLTMMFGTIAMSVISRLLLR